MWAWAYFWTLDKVTWCWIAREAAPYSVPKTASLMAMHEPITVVLLVPKAW